MWIKSISGLPSFWTLNNKMLLYLLICEYIKFDPPYCTTSFINRQIKTLRLHDDHNQLKLINGCSCGGVPLKLYNAFFQKRERYRYFFKF